MHISTIRLYSAIHVGSHWKIQDRKQILNTDSTQTKHIINHTDKRIVIQVKALSYRFLEAEVSPDEGERDGDAKPEGEKGDQSAERHRTAAAFDPQDQIENKEYTEHNPVNIHHVASLQ